MPFMPFNILGIWFRGLLSIAIIAGGVYLAKRWYDESHVVVWSRTTSPDSAPVLDEESLEAGAPTTTSARRVFRFEPGMNRETGYLVAAIVLLSFAAVGGWARRLASAVLGGSNKALENAGDNPSDNRTGGAPHQEA